MVFVMIKENEEVLNFKEGDAPIVSNEVKEEKVDVKKKVRMGIKKGTTSDRKKFGKSAVSRRESKNVKKTKGNVKKDDEIKSENIDKVLLSKEATELLSKLDSIEKARNAIQDGLKVRLESNVSTLKGMLNAFEKATESQFTIRPKMLKKSVSSLISKATVLVPNIAPKRNSLFAIDNYFKNAREELASLQDGSLLSDIRLLTAKLDELESKRMEISTIIEERFKVRLTLAKKVLEEILSKSEAISNEDAEVVHKHLSKLLRFQEKLKLEDLEVKKSSLRDIDDFMKKASREFEKIESIFGKGK